MAQDNAELPPPPHCSQEVAQLRQELAQSQEREAELKERVDYLNALVAPTEQHRCELKALVLAAQQALVDAGVPTRAYRSVIRDTDTPFWYSAGESWQRMGDVPQKITLAQP